MISASPHEPQLSASLPTPEEVRTRFEALFAQSGKAATEYLYELGLSSGYIDLPAQAKNIHWTYASAYGTLECTINCTKPEKDPQAIAAAASKDAARTAPDLSQDNQPLCDLCWENEEFVDAAGRAIKPELRIAAITLAGQKWGLQYSPYGYFTQHCIALSRYHRPLRIDKSAFERLVDFVDLFPHYFIGSNADLPIVGGSILSHDHYQGGKHIFPMMKADVEREIELAGFPNVQAGIVHWPASVLRLESKKRLDLVRAAAKILATWQEFSYEDCSILATASDGLSRHNTLNPIVRKLDDLYRMDLVLRNNRCDAEHPFGIFHPGAQLHHIKKENIGLIEIMGLAILPPRLAEELPRVAKVLAQAAIANTPSCNLRLQLDKDQLCAKHAEWATDIYNSACDALVHKAQQDDMTPSAVDALQSDVYELIKSQTAQVFAKILEVTGVFKHDASGQAGWNSFVDRLSYPTKSL